MNLIIERRVQESPKVGRRPNSRADEGGAQVEFKSSLTSRLPHVLFVIAISKIPCPSATSFEDQASALAGMLVVLLFDPPPS